MASWNIKTVKFFGAMGAGGGDTKRKLPNQSPSILSTGLKYAAKDLPARLPKEVSTDNA